MTADTDADAVVIGSGPNGLVAAIVLARKGWDVTVLERAPFPGGAVRSEPLTNPGYVHDTHSAFYGLLHASPVFAELGLGERVRWARFETPVGACVDPRTAAVIHRDLEATVKGLGDDGGAWREIVRWWERAGGAFLAQMLSPLGAVRPALRFVRRTGIRGALDAAKMLLTPLSDLARQRFQTEPARALFCSGITHSDVSVEQVGGTPAAMILAMLAQTVGMPVPVGGAGKLAEALAAMLREAGGVIRCGDAAARVVVERGRARAVVTEQGLTVRSRRAVIADTGPLALVRDLAGEEHFPSRYLDGLRRFRYGTGVFKVDIALDAPARWASGELDPCGVVHLTGSLRDMARGAYEARNGLLPARPLMIVGQQSVADPSRAPAGGATLWIEMHVPPHPTGDGAEQLGDVDGWERAREPFLERVMQRLDEHAPGLRAHVAGVAVRTPRDLEAENPNLVGGDIGGGSSAIDTQLVFRPVPGWFRYRTPVKGLYLCSASAHPGGGVHGMGGRNCARRVLRDSWRPSGIVRTAGGARRLPRRG